MPRDNIVPPHRGFRIIGEASTVFSQPLDYDPRDRFPDDSECVEDMLGGVAGAISDWISDPRFLSGIYTGVAITCLSAVLWSFVL